MNFCRKYSYIDCILNSLPASYVPWFVLSLQLPGTLLSSSYLPLSLVKTKRQTEIIYKELWGPHCHHPQFQLHSHQTSEYVSAYNSHKISSSFITLLCIAIVSTESSKKKLKRKRCTWIYGWFVAIVWFWECGVRKGLQVCNLRHNHPASRCR